MQIVEQIIKIQGKGLVTIPKNFRDELGLGKNSLARIIKEKGRLILEPLRILKYPVRSYTKTDVNEFLKLDEKENKRLQR